MILIVENDAMVRNFLREFLEIDGHEVLFSANAREAREIARAHAGRIDLLLAEVDQVADGPALYHDLRLDSPGLKAIYTAADPWSLRTDGVGSEAVLIKPFDIYVLRERINKEIGSRGNVMLHELAEGKQSEAQ